MTSSNEPSPAAADGRLGDVRRQIDAVDDRLLQALAERFDIIEEVRRAKQAGGGAVMAMRPAREAAVLRRLLAVNDGRLPARLIVRVWRAIMAEATACQDPICVHVSAATAGDAHACSLIRDHFADIAMRAHDDAAAAIAALEEAPGDVVVVALGEEWVDSLSRPGSRVRVIASLPVLSTSATPTLLILGRAPGEPSGDDETLVATSGGLPRDFAPKPLWQAHGAGGVVLTSIPGFLTVEETPLVGLKRNAGLALAVLGRYPSAITG